MAKQFYISKEGYDKLKQELEELRSVKRPELSRKIADARDFGDLKENAEYHAAREALALLETRISQIEESIRRAKIIDPKSISNEYIALYTTVLLKDLTRNLEVKYTLVSQEESNFQEAKISVISPVGKALLGRKIGETVEIQVPAGIMKYEVLDIQLQE
jgi:transcription elongation factor GreA